MKMADGKSISAVYGHARELALGRHSLSKFIPPLFLAFDALLTALVIWKVPYTEIDWKAYMEQIDQYVAGERDYPMIKGGTGPLVYPAAHVYIYRGLHYVTDGGTNILLAQALFGLLYLTTLALVMACYRQAKAPLYIFPMLVLSKRLHSIFVLRCFNDCFTVFFLWLAIYIFQRRIWTLGTLAYSWGLGIKMSLLLALPAVGIMLFLAKGIQAGLKQAWLLAQLQIVIGLPFLSKNMMGYLSKAFEFSRQFFFIWTVNWRFVGESTFLSKEFSISLLVGHISTLIIFATTRWLKPAGLPVWDMVQRALRFEEPLESKQRQVSLRVTPDYILTTILTANTIGMLFARSLHYQFYAYLAWATPFLLWRSGLNPLLQFFVWGLQEWAWNVYPSTNASSMVVVGILFVIIISVWWGTRNDFLGEKDPAFEKSDTLK